MPCIAQLLQIQVRMLISCVVFYQPFLISNHGNRKAQFSSKPLLCIQARVIAHVPLILVHRIFVSKCTQLRLCIKQSSFDK